MRYRKKPVEVEAMNIGVESMLNVARWCGGRIQTSAKASDPSDIASWLEIPTLEGIMRANKGDWVIRGVNGEFYPCKNEIFAATYEPVEVSNGG